MGVSEVLLCPYRYLEYIMVKLEYSNITINLNMVLSQTCVPVSVRLSACACGTAHLLDNVQSFLQHRLKSPTISSCCWQF